MYDESKLDRLPEHMRNSVKNWIERAEPHPEAMGSFMRSVFENKLVEAYTNADDTNARAMHAWASFLYNDAPEACRGSREQMIKWYDLHHTKEEADAPLAGE